MRETAEVRARKKERLLDATGELTKKNGFAATGIDALMAAAGVTAGAFYSRFSSKDEFLGELLEHELGKSVGTFAVDNRDQVRKAFSRYVSKQHVDHPDKGCALPALTPEISRGSPAIKNLFERSVCGAIDQIEGATGHRELAWTLLSQAVGGVMLARAFQSEKTQIELLKSLNATIAHQLSADERT